MQGRKFLFSLTAVALVSAPIANNALAHPGEAPLVATDSSRSTTERDRSRRPQDVENTQEAQFLEEAQKVASAKVLEELGIAAPSKTGSIEERIEKLLVELGFAETSEKAGARVRGLKAGVEEDRIRVVLEQVEGDLRDRLAYEQRLKECVVSGDYTSAVSVLGEAWSRSHPIHPTLCVALQSDAARNIKQAAEGGNGCAQFLLGLMHASAEGVPSPHYSRG
ncbi:MAG: hypothetical protein R6V05_03985 [Candidatus Brocadiia bacterium]